MKLELVRQTRANYTLFSYFKQETGTETTQADTKFNDSYRKT
jgi:hypothetical protein